MGRPSVVFEALPVPGGMTAVGIPEYRLPKQNLQADIDYILSHGIELRTNAPVKNIDALSTDGYKAVFIATGAHNGRSIRIEGEDVEGVVDSLVFLRARALGSEIPCGKRVAVIGGGNAAVDAARSALRMGAAKVLILYRRTVEEMPAYEEEIEAALEEGVDIHELVAPKRIIHKHGRVVGIEMMRMRLGDADESGRRRPVPVEENGFVLECDMIIPAIGQRASVEAAADMLELNSWGGIRADTVTGLTSKMGIFAGGDCVSGGATVVKAIGAGQKAAVAIDRMLGGYGALPANVGTSLRRPSEEELEKVVPRVQEPMISVEERLGCFAEVLGGLSQKEACTESGRCLRCDLERAESLGTHKGS
ncbi:NADPH-Fe(3+) oxidoreductase subunit beta [subsurface metagenome]